MEKIDDRFLQIVRKRFGYNNEELNTFESNSRNIKFITKTENFARKQIVLTVVECGSWGRIVLELSIEEC